MGLRGNDVQVGPGLLQCSDDAGRCMFCQISNGNAFMGRDILH